VFATLSRHTREPKASATTKAVLRRLRQLGENIPGPDDAWRIARTHAGCHQRSAGAWSWSLDLIAPSTRGIEHRRADSVYGGYWPAALCARVGATIGDDNFGRRTLEPPDSALPPRTPTG
jgi:hypothetical protein